MKARIGIPGDVPVAWLRNMAGYFILHWVDYWADEGEISLAARCMFGWMVLNAEGAFCYLPSHREVAKELGILQSQIPKCLKELEELRFIEAERVEGGGRGRKRYAFLKTPKLSDEEEELLLRDRKLFHERNAERHLEFYTEKVAEWSKIVAEKRAGVERLREGEQEVKKAPVWLAQRMEAVQNKPAPTVAEMDTQLKASAASAPQVAYDRRGAAWQLGISPSSIDRLVKRGLLKPSGATRRPMFSHEELVRFMRDTQV